MKPLTTATRGQLLASVEFFRGLVRTASASKRKGKLLVRLTSGEIDPGGILLLKHAGGKLNSLGWQPWVDAQNQVVNVIQDNLTHYILPKNVRHLVQKAGSYLLRGVSSREEMVGELEEWAQSVRKGGGRVPEEQVALWQTQIAEVTTNSFQHARTTSSSEQIIIAGSMRSGRVQLAALDAGVGIPTVIRPVAPRDMSDGELLAHSFKKGVTSQCVPENQGAGLHSLAKSVRSNKGGSLLVLSNNGFYQVSRGGRRKVDLDGGTDRYMDGTLTIINLMV